MSATRTRFGEGGLRPRRKPDAPNSRLVWKGLIALACGPEACARRLDDFRHQLRLASPAGFPLGDYSAQQSAKSFLELARGFCEAGSPERRELLGEGLAPLARILDVLLTEDATALARRTWNRGEG